jgi:tetratricopeptide (TPR) repeat protein
MVLPFKAPRIVQPTDALSPAADLGSLVGLKGEERALGVLRLFLSCPTFAEHERRQIERVIAVLNFAFDGQVKIDAVGLADDLSSVDMSTETAGRDAVVAILRPHTDTVGQPRTPGAMSRVFAAIDSRGPGTPLPDFLIFRQFETAQSLLEAAETDPDWERRKAMFRAWYRTRGGDCLTFDDFASPLEFTTKAYRQLRQWMARNGYIAPPMPIRQTSELQSRLETVMRDAAPIETPVAKAQPAINPVAPAPVAAAFEAKPEAASVEIAATPPAVLDLGCAPDEAEQGETQRHEPFALLDTTPVAAPAAPVAVEAGAEADLAPPAEATAAEDTAPAAAEPSEQPSQATDIATPSEVEAAAELDHEAAEQAEPEPAIETAPVEPVIEPLAAEMFAGPDKKTGIDERAATDRPPPANMPAPVPEGSPEAQPEIEPLRAAADRADEPPVGRAAAIVGSLYQTAGARFARPRPALSIAEPAQSAKKGGSRKIVAGLLAASFLVSAGTGWMWHSAAVERDHARQSLTAAADAASALVFDLTQRTQGQSDPESRNILAAAQKLQDALFAASVSSGREQKGQAETLAGSSAALLRQGNNAGALKAAMQARNIYVALAATGPAKDDLGLGLSVTNRRIGDALLAQGHSAEASAAYSESFKAAKTLADTKPDDIQLRQNLEEAHIAMGNALSAQNRLDDAIAAYRNAFAIAKALSQSEPDKTAWLRDSALGHEKIAGVLVAQNKFDDALTAYRDGLVIRRAVAQKDVGNGELQGDLAENQQRIGDVLVVQGHLDDGLAAYREALAIRKTLAQNDPNNAELQRGLYESNDSVGDAFAGQRQLDQALSAYRDAFVVAKVMALKEPSNTHWQRALVISDDKIGDVIAARNRVDY